MREYLAAFSSHLASSLAQLAIGGAIALAIALRSASRRGTTRVSSPAGSGGQAGLPAIAAAAALGSALPLGMAGAAPIAAAAGAGLGLGPLLAFLCSNLIFDSLVPFADPTFYLRTGYARILLALAAGIVAGALAKASKAGSGSLARPQALESSGAAEGARRVLARLGIAVAVLALGAAADEAFRRYALGALVGFLFSSPATAPLAELFARGNVANPIFLLAMRLVMIATDLSALAALALVLRPKGLALYLGYFAALAAVLGASALV
jgi:hypothetical protein